MKIHSYKTQELLKKISLNQPFMQEIKKKVFLKNSSNSFLFKVIKQIYVSKILTEQNNVFSFKKPLKNFKKYSFLILEMILDEKKDSEFENNMSLYLNTNQTKKFYIFNNFFLNFVKNTKLGQKNIYKEFLESYLKKIEIIFELLSHQKFRKFKDINFNKLNFNFSAGYKNYGIIKIDINFVNYNIILTTLDGKILKWIKAGSDAKQTRRTRFNSRAVGGILTLFFNRMKKSYFKKLKMKYIKIELTGPSRKFGRKLVKMIKSKTTKAFKFRVICITEGFRRSFNGCRLARKKR